MPLKIYCRNCVQYRDEWCKAISDSPDPDLMRDCGFYRDKTLFNLDKVKVNEGMKEVKGYNPSKDPRLINCKTECGNEKCYARRYGLFAEKTCHNFVEPKPATNYDRLRAKSVEEMAEFMNCGACPPGKDVSELCHDEEGGSVPDMCNLCWLNWLKQEASE